MLLDTRLRRNRLIKRLLRHNVVPADWSSFFHLNNHLHFNGDVEGQLRHSHGSAGMLSLFAEHLHKQVGYAVHHSGLGHKIRYRCHKSLHFYELFDAVQITQFLSQLRNEVQPCQPRSSVALLLGNSNYWNYIRECLIGNEIIFKVSPFLAENKAFWWSSIKVAEEFTALAEESDFIEPIEVSKEYYDAIKEQLQLYNVFVD